MRRLRTSTWMLGLGSALTAVSAAEWFLDSENFWLLGFDDSLLLGLLTLACALVERERGD